MSGTNLIMKTRVEGEKDDGQLWYFDHLTRTIKSQKFKGKSIDISNAGKGQNL